jgi:hypothetical protein
LEARAYDAAGNLGSAKVTATVANDTIAPSVAITNPQPGSVVSAATTITAAATDNNKVAKITLTINGKEVALSYGTSLSYSWDPYASVKGNGKGGGRNKTSPAGSYSIAATATDTAGNTKTASINVTVP